MTTQLNRAETTPQNGQIPAVAAVATGSVAARLTPEQIKNWRNVLCGMIGPYAMIMPDADVQRFRDQMQAKIGDPQNIADEAVRDA